MPTTPVAPAPQLTDADRLYNFAAWMFESREEARVATVAVMQGHPGLALAGLLGHLCRPLLNRLTHGPVASRGPRHLRVLDDILRSAVTIPVGPDHPLVRGELRRLYILESQLKRTCLWSVLRALPPMQRAVFVLESALGYTLAEIAEICATSVENAGISRRRAMRRLDDYLGVRCEHIDPRNMCRCRGRLGLALAQGFIESDDEHEHDLDAVQASGDLLVVYAALPRFRLAGDSTAAPG